MSQAEKRQKRRQQRGRYLQLLAEQFAAELEGFEPLSCRGAHTRNQAQRAIRKLNKRTGVVIRASLV